MPINDSEPRYRLLDSNGDVVASFYLDDSDGFNIQEATNNNEVTLASDGTFTTPALDAEQASITEVGGRGELTTNQSIDTNTTAKVNLDSEVIATTDEAVVEVDLANNKLIVKEAGVYYGVAQIALQDSANWSDGDWIQLQFHVGGSMQQYYRNFHPGSSGSSQNVVMSVTVLFEVTNPNADVDMRAYHESGSTETIRGVGFGTNLSVGRLG